MKAKYRCPYCGWVGDEEELETRREYVGEFWGMPAYDNTTVCPDCGNDEIEEVEDNAETL